MVHWHVLVLIPGHPWPTLEIGAFAMVFGVAFMSKAHAGTSTADGTYRRLSTFSVPRKSKLNGFQLAIPIPPGGSLAISAIRTRCSPLMSWSTEKKSAPGTLPGFWHVNLARRWNKITDMLQVFA